METVDPTTDTSSFGYEVYLKTVANVPVKQYTLLDSKRNTFIGMVGIDDT